MDRTKSVYITGEKKSWGFLSFFFLFSLLNKQYTFFHLVSIQSPLVPKQDSTVLDIDFFVFIKF